MIDRPCKPDADLKWLWRTLLGSTPLPACGTSEQTSTPAIEGTAAVPDLPVDADLNTHKPRNRGS
jgi:hypothetical protein